MIKKNITAEAIEGSTTAPETAKPKKVFDEKNYLNTRLKPGEDMKEIRIRLLPFDGNTSYPFHTIKMHNVQVNKDIADSGFKNYVCIAETHDIDHEKFGTKCPFCELRNEYYAKMNEAETDEEKKVWKDKAKTLYPKEVCIVRCIERGKEADGPKFWKFTLRADHKDAMSDIIRIYKNKRKESLEEEYGDKIQGMDDKQIKELCAKDGFQPYNVLDLYEGKDLKLTIEPVYENNKRTTKTSISITDYGKPQPITNDEELLEKWIDDDKKWYDVFTVKPYEYLKIIRDGGYPFFDKEQMLWVPRIEKAAPKPEDEETETPVQTNATAPKKGDDESFSIQQADDDLPF